MTINFTIVMILGITLALYAVEELFSFDINAQHYLMIDIFIVGVFSVTYLLSQIPQVPQSVKATLPPPKVEKFFTQYILTAFTGLYFVILYAYTAKVLITMDWPKGILAWLIVAFSAVAVLTYLFWTHFMTHGTSKWRKWIWLAVLLQTIMLFIAIGMRIVEYSWTENRYMILLLGMWLAGISLYFLVRKDAKIKWIFIWLSILIGISQVGPLSAYNVSKNAQIQKLHKNLTMLRQNSDVMQASANVRYEISDVVQYLYSRYGIQVLEPIFPKITADFKILEKKFNETQKNLKVKLKKGKNGIGVMPIATKKEYKKIQDIFKDKPRYYPHFITDELGFKFMSTWDLNNERYGKIQNINFKVQYPLGIGIKVQDIRGYDYMTSYHGDSYKNDKKGKIYPYKHLEDIGVNITFGNYIFKIHKNQETITIDMEAYIQELIIKHGMKSRSLTQKELTIEKENKVFKVKIEFQYLNKNNYGDSKPININARLLFKFKGEE